jgi:hypothetical protein
MNSSQFRVMVRLAAVGVVCVFLGTGCTTNEQEKSPVKVLEKYIDISFNAKTIEDKKRMEELLTGDTKTRLATWSNEQFSKAFIEANRKFQNIKVLENKKVNTSETALTYELSFQEGSDQKKVAISQRKLAVIVLEGEVWRIKEVRSIRESIEYLKELSLP